MKLFFLVIGMVMVVESLPWVVSPEWMRRRVQQLADLPLRVLRNLALLIFCCGFVLIYVVQTLSLP